jgi:NADH:ubiquinone oxidoreductase subunit 4 (subunit M)
LRAIVTRIQSDTKKLVAYRRVTHITFILLGITLNVKSIFLVTIMLSLAHGWASMGIFLGVGSTRNFRATRLIYKGFIEYAFHIFILMIGLLLIVNARIPPMPSFFPELGVLMSLIAFCSPILIILFLRIRLLVGYYNVYLYLLLSRVGPFQVIKGRFSIKEILVITLLVALSLRSLG